jgi:2-desacetyl-2-hydroxyethyl bacteriochlorophyllide A dehydrogenase
VKAEAIEFEAPGKVRVVEVDVPKRGPGDVVVETSFSGISSGTETLAFRGKIDPDVVLDESIGSLQGTFDFPFRYGYSCVGVVREGTDDLEPGRLVFCMHPHQSMLVRPRAEMLPVDGIEPRLATLLPMVETGLQVSLDVDETTGTVAVFGLGVVGILAGALLRRRGMDVIGVEPVAARRDAAAVFGIPTVEAGDAPSDVATVVECSGRPDVLADSLALLAQEGTALVASWYGNKPVELPLGGAFHRRRLTIRSTQVSSIPRRLQNEWSFEERTDAAVALMRELPLEVLATHTFALSDAQRAFEAADAGSDGLIHAALSYA